MKNSLITFALLFVVALSANAQDSFADLQEQATEKTRIMMLQYHLNEGDYYQLKSLNLDYLKTNEELKLVFRNDRSLLSAKKTAARQAYEQHLKSLVNPVRYARYQKQQPAIAQASSRK